MRDAWCLMRDVMVVKMPWQIVWIKKNVFVHRRLWGRDNVLLGGELFWLLSKKGHIKYRGLGSSMTIYRYSYSWYWADMRTRSNKCRPLVLLTTLYFTCRPNGTSELWCNSMVNAWWWSSKPWEIVRALGYRSRLIFSSRLWTVVRRWPLSPGCLWTA